MPDFTVKWRGADYYWEHLGMLHREDYRVHWERKQAWYEKHFPGRLITTQESGELSHDTNRTIRERFQ